MPACVEELSKNFFVESDSLKLTSMRMPFLSRIDAIPFKTSDTGLSQLSEHIYVPVSICASKVTFHSSLALTFFMTHPSASMTLMRIHKRPNRRNKLRNVLTTLY